MDIPVAVDPEVEEQAAEAAPSAPTESPKEPSPERPKTQYFVLSPRPSVESPTKARGSDENANRNVCNMRTLQDKWNSLPKGAPQAKAEARTVRRTNSAQVLRPNYRHQPCLRPASAERKPAEVKATSSTPRRPAPSGALAPRAGTPTRSAGASRAESRQATPPAAELLETAAADALAAMSTGSALDSSQHSTESRLSRLSKRSVTKKHLSSKDLERLAIEQKRQQVRDMINRNQVNCRRAIVAAEVRSAGRATTAVVRPVTFPREFHLSGPRTPRETRKDSASDTQSVCSDHGSLSGSIRSTASAPACGSLSARPWRPKLTVPKAPELHSTRRRRPASEDSLGQPGADASAASTPRAPAAMPRVPTPERRAEVYTTAIQCAMKAEREKAAKARQAAAAKAVAAAASAADDTTLAPAATAVLEPQAERSSSASATTLARTKERAETARLAATREKAAKEQAAREKLAVFQRPAMFTGAVGAAKPCSARSSQTIQRVPSVRMVTPPGDWQPCDLQAPSAAAPVPREASASAIAAPRPRRPSFGSSASRPCCR